MYIYIYTNKYASIMRERERTINLPMKTTYSFCCRWLLCFSLIATLFIQQDYLPALLRLEDQSADLWSYVECNDVNCVFSSTLITRWARDTEITLIAMKSHFFWNLSIWAEPNPLLNTLDLLRIFAQEANLLNPRASWTIKVMEHLGSREGNQMMCVEKWCAW